MITFAFISFIAGMLTVLAPCVLPLLPVVIGSTAGSRSRATPFIVVGSLALSIIIFTYVLKVSTAFVMIPAEVWSYLSGGILTLFGLTLLLPHWWAKVPGVNRLTINSNKVMGSGYQQKSFWGDVLVGASLGPIFSTCSPTYFVILASVLPVSFFLGSIYLLAYTFGLGLVLLLVGVLGERFTHKLTWLADPESWFKRGLGLLFIILGLAIAVGWEKKLETSILNSGYFDVTKVETGLLQQVDKPVPLIATSTDSTKIAPLPGVPYKELVNPSGFVNTGGRPIKIGDYVGKKVILLEILTYSCINCQRTFPYVTAWYNKYKDDGFIVIGIHTPEFAFEKDEANVAAAMKKFGITFPVVLDNDYGTWNAYGNKFWPRKYLIDIHGNVVYDHIGEGAYDEIEMKIKDLLKERAQFLGEAVTTDNNLAVNNVAPVSVSTESPETYFGAARNEFLANGARGVVGEQNLVLPKTFNLNSLYLGGGWKIDEESVAPALGAQVVYRYKATNVYLVASGDSPVVVEVWQDGVLQKEITIKESELYQLVHNPVAGEHILELKVRDNGAHFYTITFG